MPQRAKLQGLYMLGQQRLAGTLQRQTKAASVLFVELPHAVLLLGPVYRFTYARNTFGDQGRIVPVRRVAGANCRDDAGLYEYHRASWSDRRLRPLKL